MDTEFHYWITGIVARQAGFSEEDAITIAHASQYVDDNYIIFVIKDRQGGADYSNYISQTVDILKPKRELMRVYPLFHFVPGEPTAASARRRDGKMHVLDTTPDSANANKLFDAASSTTEYRLYRLGIATHAYSDTWAHQNFVGWFDNFNGLGKLAPNIGHADATQHPDRVNHVWQDPRVVRREVSNNERFLDAAKELFDRYRRYLATTSASSWETVSVPLKNLLHQDTREKRLAAYKAEAPWLPEYKAEQWLEDAIDTEVHGLADQPTGIGSYLPRCFPDEHFWRAGDAFQASNWYQFQEAVKEHQKVGMTLLVPIYEQMDVEWSVV